MGRVSRKLSRKNPDDKIRKLHRLALQGDNEDKANYLAALVKAGDLSIRNIKLASVLQAPEAKLLEESSFPFLENEDSGRERSRYGFVIHRMKSDQISEFLRQYLLSIDIYEINQIPEFKEFLLENDKTKVTDSDFLEPAVQRGSIPEAISELFLAWDVLKTKAADRRPGQGIIWVITKSMQELRHWTSSLIHAYSADGLATMLANFLLYGKIEGLGLRLNPSDERRRALERSLLHSGEEGEVALIQENLRSGKITTRQVQIATLLGDSRASQIESVKDSFENINQQTHVTSYGFINVFQLALETFNQDQSFQLLYALLRAKLPNTVRWLQELQDKENLNIIRYSESPDFVKKGMFQLVLKSYPDIQPIPPHFGTLTNLAIQIYENIFRAFSLVWHWPPVRNDLMHHLLDINMPLHIQESNPVKNIKDLVCNLLLGLPARQKNPTIPLGECFSWAWHYVNNNNRAKLVHGTITDPWSKKKLKHAWVEVKKKVIDYQSDLMNRPNLSVKEFYNQWKPKNIHKYNQEQATIKLLKNKHFGPWHKK